MLGVGWVPDQLFHTFDHISTPAFYLALVIVIRSHILESG
jgi:hypothetical protein